MNYLEYGVRQEGIADHADDAGNRNVAIMHYALAVMAYERAGSFGRAISVAEKVGDEREIKRLKTLEKSCR